METSLGRLMLLYSLFLQMEETGLSDLFLACLSLLLEGC